MQFKPPQQYGSPLLAILRGGKQAVKPPVFGVTQQPTFPTQPLPQAPLSTLQTAVRPAQTVVPPQMTPYTPPVQAVNPLDIIRKGKEQSITQADPQGVVKLYGGKVLNELGTLAKGDTSALGSPVSAGKTIGKFAFNIPNYIMAGFVATGRSIMEETLPRVFPNVTKESVRKDFDSAKGIDEWLMKGEVDTWQEIKEKMQEAIDKSPNAKEWEKKYLPVSVAVAGFALDASGFGKPASKSITQGLLENLAKETDQTIIARSLLEAGTPVEVINVALPSVARARTPEEIQSALVRASEQVLNGIPHQAAVEADTVLLNMSRDNKNPLRIPADDSTRYRELREDMDKRPLTPDELAESKAIIERADGRLPRAEVGAMDIKKPAPVKVPEPKDFKTAEEYVKAQGTPVYRGGNPIDLSKVTDQGISTSKVYSVAEQWKVHRSGGVVEDVFISPSAKIHLPQKVNTPINFAEKQRLTFEAQNKNADVLDLSKYGEAEMVILNPSKIKTRTQLIDEWKSAQPKTPTVPTRDYPGLRKQGGFADFFAPIKAKETAPTVKPKTEQRIKIDADIKDIRKSLQNKDLTAKQIGELETRLSIMEDAIPDVSLIRRIAGKQLANGDTLSQVQATAMKIVAQSDFLKSISKADAERILKSPKSFTAREVEGARVVRRANLDDRVTELGYADLDEAGDAVAQFDRIREEMAALKPTLKEAKDTRALSNKVTKLVTTATTKRREEVKFLKDQFGLVDSDVRKASHGRDFRTMSEGRFNDTVREMEQIGIVRVDTMQAKAELMDLMERRNFQKVENYRKAQELPPISDMTATQLRQYSDALEKFQTDDIFLTQRQLEVVDRSNLKGVRTLREAKERLLEQIKQTKGMENVKLEDLNVTPTMLDTMRYDTALAEKNPFYNYLVTRTQTHMISGETKFLDVQTKVLDLAKKANASRERGIGGAIKQAFVPKHDEIIRYLEAPVDQKATFAKSLTKEELDYANFVSDYYSKAYDHLVMQKELYGSRYVDTYFTHIRRDFLEAWTDDGFVKAMKEWWQSQKDSQMVANIIDQDTGQILPKSKFFQYTMQRTGEITPSKNLTRVFLQYSKAMERKKMFDAMIPELDIYVQSLTPTALTPKGLEMDRQLKTFVNQYINNKKGRQVNFSGVIKQSGPADIALRTGNTLVSVIDLGFSLIAQSAAAVGEFVTTYQALGKIGLAKSFKRRIWDTGLKRMSDTNANKILKESEAFIGRNIWTDIADTDTPLMERGMKTIFAGFGQSTVEANKTFLLGSISPAELRAGKLSAERLAELRLSAGRWRDMGGDVKSIVGSTSLGQMTTKYKGWAIPIARTNIKNISTLVKTLGKGDIKKALTSREIQETYRLVELSTVMVVLGSYVMAQNEEDTFIGKLKARAYMEANTLLGGIDPAMFLSTPRLMTFLQSLAKNLKSIALLEEYNTDSQWGEEGDLKGVKGLQRQFTPSAIRTLQKPATSTGDKDLDAVKKEEATSRKEATDKVESVFKEVQNMPTEQLRERLAQEEPDVINKVVDKLLEAKAKEQDPEQFKKDSQIKKLTNESKAKYVITQLDKLPIEERREYIKGLLEREVISVNVVNRVAELADERGIIEQ